MKDIENQNPNTKETSNLSYSLESSIFVYIRQKWKSDNYYFFGCWITKFFPIILLLLYFQNRFFFLMALVLSKNLTKKYGAAFFENIEQFYQ